MARRLIAEKVAGQAQTLGRLDGVEVPEETVTAMRVAATRLHVAVGRDEIRMAEATTAGAYWSALSGTSVRFARRDAERVPAHWLTLGSRTSPLTGGPRLASNPANAILNCLYAILEGEATIAARVVGLDPGLGVLHADQQNRDSLAADLMEPVRPLVDRYVFELLARRTFAADDFYETRQGVCRVTPPLARELALTAPDWARAVGRVAEDVARLLDAGSLSTARWPVATPLSGLNPSAGRGRASVSREASPVQSTSRGCVQCGAPTVGRRRTCSNPCEVEARAAQGRAPFEGAGVRALTDLRAKGIEPVDDGARARMGARQQERQREENEWNAAHPKRAEPEVFRREVLPGLQGVPLRELARRTGLSVSNCARIRRGEAVPHERWWGVLDRDFVIGG